MRVGASEIVAVTNATVACDFSMPARATDSDQDHITLAIEKAVALFAAILLKKELDVCQKLMRNYQLFYHPDKLKILGIDAGTPAYKFFEELAKGVNAAFGEYNDSDGKQTKQALQLLTKLSPDFFKEQAEHKAREKEQEKRDRIAKFQEQEQVLKDIIARLQGTAPGKVCVNREVYTGQSINMSGIYNDDKRAVAITIKVKFSERKELNTYAEFLKEAHGLEIWAIPILQDSHYVLVVYLNDLENARTELQHLLPQVRPSANASGVALQQFMWRYFNPYTISTDSKLSNALSEACDAIEGNHGLSCEEVDGKKSDYAVAQAIIDGMSALQKAKDEISEHEQLTPRQKENFIGQIAQQEESLIYFCRSDGVNNAATRDGFFRGHAEVVNSIQQAMPYKINALNVFLGIVASIVTLGLANVSGKFRQMVWGAPPVIAAIDEYRAAVSVPTPTASPAA